MAGRQSIPFLCLLLAIISAFSVAETVTEHDSQRRQLLEDNYMKSLQEYANPHHLMNLAKAEKDAYSKRSPFPHFYIDGLFPKDVLAAVEKEIVENPPLDSNGCVKDATICYRHKGNETFGKNAFNNADNFGPATATLFAFLKKSSFIKFLEELTSIRNLIPDPHFVGSGVHQTMRGGYLNIHADFNRYVRYNLHRRVNVFIYLNPSWDEAWGGHLELWARDMKTCNARIAPVLGRLVVFSSTDFTYHGHPQPLTCPDTRSRRSLALYYYTATRPKEECVDNRCDAQHTSLYQTPKCASCADPKCQRLTNAYSAHLDAAHPHPNPAAQKH